MNKQTLLTYMLETEKDFYYNEKSKKLYITQGFFDDISLIISNSSCVRDMVKTLQYDYNIINEKLAYKLIDGVRLSYKCIEVL